MSSPKIYTSQEFQQSLSICECPRCHEQQEIYIQLNCSHKFCILCITFSFLKFKNTLEGKNQIKCLECEKVSELDEQLNQLIGDIINKELGPIVKNESDNNQSRMSINQKNTSQSNKSQRNAPPVNVEFLEKEKRSLPINNPKSQKQSIAVNGALTPNKNSKGFYSKCQSPNDSSTKHESDCCKIHPTEDISYICMTCSVKPLCYKCIKSNKHANHEVKIVKKAIEIINEKLSLISLQTAQKIQNIELYQKRLYDRKLIFEERIEKNIKQIKTAFNNLERTIIQKTNQIIAQYEQFYQSKVSLLQDKSQQSSQTLKNIKSFQQRVHQFLNFNQALTKSNSQNTRVSKVIQMYGDIQSQRKRIYDCENDSNLLFQKNDKVFYFHQNILEPINYNNFELTHCISKITEAIENMSLSNLIDQGRQGEKQRLNETIPYTSIMKSDILFNKNKTMGLRNCSSREKLPKNNFCNEENLIKRIKTNVPASLNTSRDKRQKKHNTKTEQDERRLKSKANYKTQANTQAKYSNVGQKSQKSKQIPNYITKCIERHNMANNGSRKVSPYANGTVYLMENIQNSKNNSKLVSKTSHILNNDELNNRKKNKESFQADCNPKERKNMIKSAKNHEILKKKR